MEINKIIEFLQHPKTEWGSKTHQRIESGFDTTPSDFLKFAEMDLAATYAHNLINALSNAKRALDCQIDTLLIGFGFYEEAKNKMWGFPKKLEKIKEFGILAPRVLNKINRTRNIMEHEFVKPNREKVEDFVDIASLFLASTDKYIFDLPGDLHLSNGELKEFEVEMNLDLEQKCLTVVYHPKSDKGTTKNFNSGDAHYIELLKAYLNIDNYN